MSRPRIEVLGSRPGKFLQGQDVGLKINGQLIPYRSMKIEFSERHQRVVAVVEIPLEELNLQDLGVEIKDLKFDE